MFDVILSIELTDLAWSSDWDGDDVGYPKSEIVGMYSQERDDGRYRFYIDMDTGRVLGFWKDEVAE